MVVRFCDETRRFVTKHTDRALTSSSDPNLVLEKKKSNHIKVLLDEML